MVLISGNLQRKISRSRKSTCCGPTRSSRRLSRVWLSCVGASGRQLGQSSGGGRGQGYGETAVTQEDDVSEVQYVTGQAITTHYIPLCLFLTLVVRGMAPAFRGKTHYRFSLSIGVGVLKEGPWCCSSEVIPNSHNTHPPRGKGLMVLRWTKSNRE